jgi:hypothetical protein
MSETSDKPVKPGPEPQPGPPSAPRLTKDGRPRKKTGVPKGVRPGGKKKGTKNKATVRREEYERIAREAAAAVVGEQSMAETFDRKTTPDKKRAKKVLETFMELFAGMAATYQPLPPGQELGPEEKKRRSPDENRFKEYATLAVETAKALAPFQDPRYSAMVIGATVVTKIKVEGGMPTDFKAGPTIDAEPIPPLTVISAEDDQAPVLPTPKAVNE